MDRPVFVRGLAFARAVARHVGGRTLPVVILVGLGAVLDGVGILLLLPLLASLFEGGRQVVTIGVWDVDLGLATSAPRLAFLLGAFAALMVVRVVVLWMRDRLLASLQVGFVESLRASVAHRLSEARWETLARLGHARVTHLMGGDVQRCGAGVHFMFQGGVAVVILVVQAAIALALAPLLALAALVLLAAGAAIMQVILRGSHEAGARVTAANLSLMTNLGRFLTGLKMAMSQNLQHAFVRAFEDDLKTAAAQQVAFTSRQSLVRGMWSLLGTGVAGSIVLVGHFALHLPSVVLLALLVVLWRIAGPAAQIQGGLQQIAYSLSAWEAVQSVERDLERARPAPVSGPRDAANTPALSGPVRLDSVVYLHGEPGDRPAGVCHLDLTIERGDFVAVVGASGSGKTTFADLLSGLLSPQSGRILVGEVEIDEATVPLWRERVAYVAQDPVLFNDTVRRNLLWGAPAATDDGVATALAVTGADRVVERLKAGMDTVVGERGALVSGGERQRLVLSRALLRSPEVLILDEATSAIDLESERDILLHLRDLPARPTIILITHRRESVTMCDRLLEFRDGEIVADTRLTPSGPAR
ncbi:MAG: ATP-binding cassette domain-containing protein [Brevundimonas sp.]